MKKPWFVPKKFWPKTWSPWETPLFSSWFDYAVLGVTFIGTIFIIR